MPVYLDVIAVKAIHRSQLIVVLGVDISTVLDQDCDHLRRIAPSTHAAHVQRAGPTGHDQIGNLAGCFLTTWQAAGYHVQALAAQAQLQGTIVTPNP